MTDDDLFPLFQRSLGSAIITGASGAGMALAMARPMAADALAMAYETALEARKAAIENGREGLRQVRSAGDPAFKTAFEAKNRLRHRAVGMLPPGPAGALDALRHQRIEGEKLAYYASKRLMKDLEPAREMAFAKSQSLLTEAVLAFGDVAEVALATSLKFGEELQRGEFEPPKPKAQAKRTQKKSARRKPTRR